MFKDLIGEMFEPMLRKFLLNCREEKVEDFHGLVNDSEYQDREVYEYSSNQAGIAVKMRYSYQHRKVGGGGVLEDSSHRLEMWVNQILVCNRLYKPGVNQPVPAEFTIAKIGIIIANPKSTVLKLMPSAEE